VENNTRAPTPGKRGTPRARPEPDSLGRVNKLILNQEVYWKPQVLKQLSNPANCCLRLRFIRLSSLSLHWCSVGYEGAWLV